MVLMCSGLGRRDDAGEPSSQVGVTFCRILVSRFKAGYFVYVKVRILWGFWLSPHPPTIILPLCVDKKKKKVVNAWCEKAPEFFRVWLVYIGFAYPVIWTFTFTSGCHAREGVWVVLCWLLLGQEEGDTFPCVKREAQEIKK